MSKLSQKMLQGSGKPRGSRKFHASCQCEDGLQALPKVEMVSPNFVAVQKIYVGQKTTEKTASASVMTWPPIMGP